MERSRPARGLLGALALATLGAAPAPRDLVARWRLAGEPLLIGSRPQDAGAVSSLVFRGKEFIASRENGWLLQGAGGYGAWAECFNPTLAGARYDPPGTTSSRLLWARVDANRYATSTQMAFWTPPGRRCSDAFGVRRIARNTTVLSDTLYTQTLTPGVKGVPRAIDDHVVITTPGPAATAGFEVLTGYLPPEFDRFYAYDADARRLAPLADRELTTERFSPEVVSTADGRFAMGVAALSPLTDAHYAAYRNAEVSKWSLVYHYPAGLGAGPHRYECAILLGTRAEVLSAMQALAGSAERARLAGWGRLLLIVAALAAVALGLQRLRSRTPLRPLGERPRPRGRL